MSQVPNSKPKRHYFVTSARDGSAQLRSCSPPGGYLTVADAKEAEIKEIKEEIRFHVEIIGGLSNDIKETNEQQARSALRRKINEFLNEIEKAREKEEKVRRLSFEDKSL